jgi:hypothetical protein
MAYLLIDLFIINPPIGFVPKKLLVVSLLTNIFNIKPFHAMWSKKIRSYPNHRSHVTIDLRMRNKGSIVEVKDVSTEKRGNEKELKKIRKKS